MNIRLCLLAGLGLLVGCGQGDELQRVGISGKISYQGQPIPEGVIVFVPIEGTRGPGASAIIKDGVYNVTAGGGAPVGKYRVEIQAIRAVASAGSKPNRPGPLQDMPPKESYLPAKYNRDSTLEVVIDGTAASPQNFDLK